jgi:hypothetical protein
MTVPYHQNQLPAAGCSSPELIGLNADEPEALALADFKNVFGIPAGELVLCSGMGLNVCASTVFGKEFVTHLVSTSEDHQTLLTNGYRSAFADLRTYRPTTKADLLIAIDSEERLRAASLRRCLRVGGLAVMNNLTGWVDACEVLPRIQLVAALVPSLRNENATWRADHEELNAIRNRMTAFDETQILPDATYERTLLNRTRAGDPAAAEELENLKILNYLDADPYAVNEYGPYYDGLFVFKHGGITITPA